MKGYAKYIVNVCKKNLQLTVIGKTGYYRWYDASDEEWHMSSATFFGETLVMGNPLGESSFDIEFLLVNRVEFVPDEEIMIKYRRRPD